MWSGSRYAIQDPENHRLESILEFLFLYFSTCQRASFVLNFSFFRSRKQLIFYWLTLISSVPPINLDEEIPNSITDRMQNSILHKYFYRCNLNISSCI